MKRDTRPDGKYANIGITESNLYYGTVVEVWEGWQWSISHCTDYTMADVHRWLYDMHGIKYENITLDQN